MKNLTKKTKLVLLFIFALTSITSTFKCQIETPFLDWQNKKGSQSTYTELSSTVDLNGNSIIAGATLNSNGDYDILISKQNKYGNEIWTSQVAGSGNGDDFAASIAHDLQGNIYICGAIDNSGTQQYDFWVRKYSPSGDVSWTIELANQNGGNRIATDIAIDENQNLFVSGVIFTANEGSNFEIFKFNSNGQEIWSAEWDSNGMDDGATHIKYKGGKLLVGGIVQATSLGWRVGSIKINALTGAVLSTFVSTGSSMGLDEIHDVKIDDSDNYYLVGKLQSQETGVYATTIKLNSSLEELWVDSLGTNVGIGKGIVQDENGNLYVAGTFSNNEISQATLRKISNNGDLIWTYEYSELSSSEGVDVVYSTSDGNPIMVINGAAAMNQDVILVKIDSETGEEIWSVSYNSPANGDDKAVEIKMDNEGGVLIVAQCEGYVEKEYVTLRFIVNDVYLPPNIGEWKSGIHIAQGAKQVLDENGQQVGEVDLLSKGTSPAIFYNNGTISMMFSAGDSTNVDLQRMDFELNKSNTDVRFWGVDKGEMYYNHYNTAFSNLKIENVPTYNGMYSPKVYQGIDVCGVLNTSTSGSLFFITQPGVDIGVLSIDTQSEADWVSVPGSILYETINGPLTFSYGNTYKVLPNGNWDTTSIDVQLIQYNNGFGLNSLGLSYDSQVIVYEINYQLGLAQATGGYVSNSYWSTYFGNNLYDTSLEGTFNQNNFIHNVGISLDVPLISTLNYVVEDTTILKHSYLLTMKEHGQPIWQTTVGSSNSNILAYNVICSDDLNIYVSGDVDIGSSPTLSIPIIGNSAQPQPGGGLRDGFILKSDIFGIIDWSTYWGGAGNDKIMDITTQSVTGHVFAVGNTTSQLGFPLQNSGGLYRSAFAPDSYKDGFVSQISSSGDIIWSTYYGPNNPSSTIHISGCSMESEANRRLIISGTMKGSITELGQGPIFETNNGFPICWHTPLDFTNSNYYGSLSGFISEFNVDSYSLIWSTLLPWDSNPEISQFVNLSSADINDDFMLAVIGSVFSNNGFITSSNNINSYQQSTLLAGDPMSAFIMSFRNRQIEWSTIFGGPIDDLGFGVDWDLMGNLYCIGSTLSPGSPFTTDNCNQEDSYFFPTCQTEYLEYFNSQNSGYFDVFLARFNSNYQQTWGTFYGGSGEEQSKNINVRQDGTLLYFTGGTNVEFDFPLYDWGEGAYYQDDLGSDQDINSTDYDAFLAAFEILLPSDLNKIPNDWVELTPFPNPATESVWIPFIPSTDSQSCTLIDGTGRVIRSINCPIQTSEINLDLKDVSPGLYTISYTRPFTKSVKLIIQ